ncbi:5022_t:CDS:1, partial [Entrophospora sp. SA101]
IKDSSLGVMVVLTNSTEMLKYLNPNGKIAWYYKAYSCMNEKKEPVSSCIKSTTPSQPLTNTKQVWGTVPLHIIG